MANLEITIELLNRCLRAMRILDIIITPEEDAWLRLINGYSIKDGYKYVIDNGSGDSLIIYFVKNQVLIKGFDHENGLNQYACDNWNDSFFKHVYQGIPNNLLSLLIGDELNETTFCMWYDQGWHQNEIIDNDGGKDYLLGYICNNEQEWCNWANDYYEKEFNLDVVSRVYQGEELTLNLIKLINPDSDVQAIFEEIKR